MGSSPGVLNFYYLNVFLGVAYGSEVGLEPNTCTSLSLITFAKSLRSPHLVFGVFIVQVHLIDKDLLLYNFNDYH